LVRALRGDAFGTFCPMRSSGISQMLQPAAVSRMHNTI